MSPLSLTTLRSKKEVLSLLSLSLPARQPRQLLYIKGLRVWQYTENDTRIFDLVSSITMTNGACMLI